MTIEAKAKTKYAPYLGSLCAGMSFEGENAMEIAEKVLKSTYCMEQLSLRGLAGYELHGVKLSKAVENLRGVNQGLTRVVTLTWHELPSLPQEAKGQTNSIVNRAIYLENGKNDLSSDTEWVWEKVGDQLVAKEV